MEGLAYQPSVPHREDESKEIIGISQVILDVLKNVKIVGSSNASVLILGESGTGKELVAQSVHRNSPRSNKPFVVINCAALPPNLIESELFGHEKGAFTGAFERRTGKFEQANGGTVFLDEIGELPPALQVKLLRVLQEKEVEPIGGRTRRVDVRIVAATNRNLEDEVAAGRFRLDLFYRLNVFPISLPALRERKADIPLLAKHFLHLYARREGKRIAGLADDVLKAMLDYTWPGNIRELENMMARSVLLTGSGQVVASLLLPKQKEEMRSVYSRVKSITENEKDYILAVLEMCNWKIYGPDGAAELLKLNPSTLNSRMKKLGIEKQISMK